MEKIGKIIKILCFATLMIVCAAIIIRICIMTDTSKLSKVVENDILTTSYNENSNLSFKTHKVYDEISKMGYFSAYALLYIEDCNQLQVSVRYNDSVYSYNDFEVDKEFNYYLYDSKTDEFTQPTIILDDEKAMYNYRRFVFDNIDVTDGGDYYLYIDYDNDGGMIVKDDIFDNIPVHYSSQKWEKYKLSKEEKNSLK